MSYKNVAIPVGKEPKEYSYLERRAEILSLILQSGHPRLLSQSTLAQKYGVSPSQICLDFGALRKSIRENLGNDAELITYSVYNCAIMKLMEKEKYYEAWKVVDGFNRWLFDLGVKQKAPEKHEVKGDFTSETLRKVWEEVQLENQGEKK